MGIQELKDVRASRRKYPRNVIALGWVSLFTDMASEMLYPVIPLFVTGPLGASPAILGLIEGIAEGGSTVLRYFAGAISDHYRARKPFVFWGYTVSAISKPVMGLAALAIGWPLLLAARILDRLGKSIRTAPRDALIVDSTAAAGRGAAFGLHRAMDTTGAVLGPAVALLVLWVWPNVPLQYLFFLAVIPGACSSVLALSAIEDIADRGQRKTRPAVWHRYPEAFWRVLVVIGVFSLANSSDSFLILRARDMGLSFVQVVMAFMLYNVVYAGMSAPMGSLSDRVGRRPMIMSGWMVYAVVYAGFARFGGSGAAWILFAAYGLYQAMSEGVTKALISDSVSEHDRAGAIGLTYTVAGLAQLAASIAAGAVWEIEIRGMRLTFLLGAGLSLCAVLLLVLRVPRKRQSAHC